MAKRDTKKVAKYARDAYEWTTDFKPKGQRKQKRKERQDGKKIIRELLCNCDAETAILEYVIKPWSTKEK